MSMRTLEENIARLEAVQAETKEITRLAHEAIQEAKATIKELRAEHERWAEGVKKEVDEALSRQVTMGLGLFMGEIKEQTTSAHDKVIQEFDKLKNIMLYGNEEGKGHSLVQDWVAREVAREVAAVVAAL